MTRQKPREAYPEGDQNFPELWNRQRATMMQIMDAPYLAELLMGRRSAGFTTSAAILTPEAPARRWPPDLEKSSASQEKSSKPQSRRGHHGT
jgi:hypothetical protein